MQLLAQVLTIVQCAILGQKKMALTISFEFLSQHDLDTAIRK